MIKIEIEREKKSYGTILNKPNQLIEIDRKNLTKFHNEIIDFCLHECQTMFYLDSLNEATKNYTYKDYIDQEFQIDLNEFLLKTGGKNFRIKDKKWAEESAKSLARTLIITKSKFKFKAQAILPLVDIDLENGVLNFKVSSDILKAMMSDEKLIGEHHKEDIPKSYYTSYNYTSVNAYDLNATERALYENILMNIYHLYKYPNNSAKYEFVDFLDILGIDTKNVQYAKNKIKKTFENVILKTKINLEYSYKLKGEKLDEDSRYVPPKFILIKVTEFKNSKNREIIEFIKKGNVDQHEYKEIKNVYIDYFEHVDSDIDLINVENEEKKPKAIKDKPTPPKPTITPEPLDDYPYISPNKVDELALLSLYCRVLVVDYDKSKLNSLQKGELSYSDYRKFMDELGLSAVGEITFGKKMYLMDTDITRINNEFEEIQDMF